MSEATPESTEGVWCVVANVKREHSYGEGGVESKSGTRQFCGGTKVYIGECFPGMCKAVVCIGLHRKSRKFITCALSVTHLENFRAKVAYHPEVIRRLRLRDTNGAGLIDTQEEAEMFA